MWTTSVIIVTTIDFYCKTRDSRLFSGNIDGNVLILQMKWSLRRSRRNFSSKDIRFVALLISMTKERFFTGKSNDGLYVNEYSFVLVKYKYWWSEVLGLNFNTEYIEKEYNIDWSKIEKNTHSGDLEWNSRQFVDYRMMVFDYRFDREHR